MKSYHFVPLISAKELHQSLWTKPPSMIAIFSCVSPQGRRVVWHFGSLIPQLSWTLPLWAFLLALFCGLVSRDSLSALYFWSCLIHLAVSFGSRIALVVLTFFNGSISCHASRRISFVPLSHKLGLLVGYDLIPIFSHHISATHTSISFSARHRVTDKSCFLRYFLCC